MFLILYIRRANSRINGCLYIPWSDSDLQELKKVSKLGSKFEGKQKYRASDKRIPLKYLHVLCLCVCFYVCVRAWVWVGVCMGMYIYN